MASTTFGREISCTGSLRTGRYVTGNRLLAEAAYRRLTTPRGQLLGGDEEADYGLDLLDLIGSVATDADAASLPGRISSELTKDERIEKVGVVVTATTTGPAITWKITIEATAVEGGGFTLVVAVDDVSVQLLGITTEDT